MTTAEKWVKQQESYRDYSFETRPKINRQKRKKAAMSARDRSRILLLIMIAGIISLGMIISSAYCAAINYNNNKMIAENNAIRGEVESLEIRIQTANNIATIEANAMKQGMIYPEGAQLIVVSGQEKPAEGFSGLLKAKAYS